MFSTLPQDMKTLLFSFFPPQALTRFACTSKENNRDSSAQVIWKSQVRKEFNTDVPENCNAKTYFSQLFFEREALIHYLFAREILESNYKILIEGSQIDSRTDARLKEKFRKQLVKFPCSAAMFCQELFMKYGVVEKQKNMILFDMRNMVETAFANPQLLNVDSFNKKGLLWIAETSPNSIVEPDRFLSNKDLILQNFQHADQVMKVVKAICILGLNTLLELLLKKAPHLSTFMHKEYSPFLMYAGEYGRLDTIKLLVEHNADVNAVSMEWSPPLIYLVVWNMAYHFIPTDLTLIEFLLNQNVDLFLECTSLDRNYIQDTTLTLCERIRKKSNSDELNIILDRLIDHDKELAYEFISNHM